MNAGVIAIDLVDPVQAARLPLHVLYPTEAAARTETFGPYAIDLARDAPPAAGTFPLVLVSHGNGSSPWTMRDLAASIARAGFVVAMIEHTGNSRGDNSLADTAANLVNRPRHLALAMDAVLGDARIGSHVAPPPFGAIGHSIGGYSVLALAGGQPTALPHQTDDGTMQPLEVAHDARLGALVLLAPATIWLAAPGALAAVTAPIFMRTGAEDAIAPAICGEIVTRGVRGPVDHAVVARAGHFSFQSPFPPAMARPDFPPAHDPPGFDRVAYVPVLAAEVIAFLRARLSA